MRAEWSLPWPPQPVNRLYRVSPRTGRIYLQDANRAWKIGVGNIVKASGLGRDLPRQKPLAVTMVQHPPKGWHGDLDGEIKLVLDGVFTGLGLNDYWIVELHAFRGPTCAEPSMVVTLEEARDG